MKKLFFGLLFVNVVYFLWNFMVEPYDTNSRIVSTEQRRNDGIETMVLVRESPDREELLRQISQQSITETDTVVHPTDPAEQTPSQETIAMVQLSRQVDGKENIHGEVNTHVGPIAEQDRQQAGEMLFPEKVESTDPQLESASENETAAIEKGQSEQLTQIEISDTPGTASKYDEGDLAEPDSEEQPLVVKRCYKLGPFPNLEMPRAIVDGLDPQPLWYEIDSSSVEVQSGFWVLYPPGESLEDSKVNLEMLRSRGLKDVWLFKDGELRGAISLGLFNAKGRAEKLLRSLKKRSIEAELRPWISQTQQYWLRVLWKDKRSLLEKPLDKFTEEIEELQITIIENCQADEKS